jgi:hypothetical protein
MEEGWLIVVIFAVALFLSLCVIVVTSVVDTNINKKLESVLFRCAVFSGVVSGFGTLCTVVPRLVLNSYIDLPDGSACAYKFQCKSGNCDKADSIMGGVMYAVGASRTICKQNATI